MQQPRGSHHWSRWVLANSLGELLGLGSTLAMGVGLFSGLSEAPGVGPALVSVPPS